MVDLHSKITGVSTNENDDLKTAVERLCKVVIPHLLSPDRLKDSIFTGQQKIKPCLVHGDLWIGNTGTMCNTADTGGEPVIFDPAAFYAHNEYELGNWVPERCGFGGGLRGGEFVREYERLYPPQCRGTEGGV